MESISSKALALAGAWREESERAEVELRVFRERAALAVKELREVYEGIRRALEERAEAAERDLIDRIGRGEVEYLGAKDRAQREV